MTYFLKLPSIRPLRFILLFALFLQSFSTLAGDEPGRYQATVLHEGAQGGKSAKLIPKVFIMDTKDGHMWVLEQNTKLHKPKGEFAIGTVLIYQGRVRPGKKMGEIIEEAEQF